MAVHKHKSSVYIHRFIIIFEKKNLQGKWIKNAKKNGINFEWIEISIVQNTIAIDGWLLKLQLEIGRVEAWTGGETILEDLCQLETS